MSLLPLSMAGSTTPVKQSVMEFKGINRGPSRDDGEMMHMKNLSASEYPSLYQRAKRGVLTARFWNPVQAFEFKGKLAVIDRKGDFSTAYLDDGNVIKEILTVNGELSMVSINNYLVFFPVGKWYNDVTGQTGTIEQNLYLDATGTGIPSGSLGGEMTGPTPGTVKTLRVGIGYSVYFYTGGTDEYDRIGIIKDSTTSANTGGTISNAFDCFKAGDAISITGCTTNPANNTECQILKISGNWLYVPANTFVLPEADEGTSATSHESTNKNRGRYVKETGSVLISRKAPKLDYVKEYNNRLWGVNNEDNTIYSCKLGDPTNWFFYQDTTLDSYAVEVGTEGEFTGIGTYGTYMLFFKESSITLLSGNYPAQYTTQNLLCHGVQKGCERSVVNVNGTCFYKSRVGVMAYSGGYPEHITDGFHKDTYSNAVAGTDKDTLYMSMMGADGKWHMFTFNVTSGLWHEQDETNARYFFEFDSELCFCDETTGAILKVANTNVTDFEPIQITAVSQANDILTLNYRIGSGEKAGLRHGVNVRINGKFYTVRYRYADHVDLYVNSVNEENVDSIKTGSLIVPAIEDDIEWMAELGPFHEWMEDKKIYSRISGRYQLDDGASLHVEIRVDDGEWRNIGYYSREKKKSIFLPITPTRCDTFSIRLTGRGYCRVDSLVRSYRGGASK